MKKLAILLCLSLAACVPTSGSGDSSSSSSASSESAQAYAAPGCVIGGCSAHICSDDTGEPVMSTCEWTDAYACYRNARCEKQADGTCGWTMSSELSACLLNPPAVDA